MSELRIHWADLEACGACGPGRIAFLRDVARQGHGQGEVLIYPDGWTQAETDLCMSLKGGPDWLTFLEFYGFVPVLKSDPAAFSNPRTKIKRGVISRRTGVDGYCRVPGTRGADRPLP